MAGNPLGKKPGLEIMIGVGGKPKPKQGSPAEEKGESKAEAAREIASGKGTPSDKKKVAKKSPVKPGPQDKMGAIARRLAALNGGGPSPTNNDAGNASGGLPGM